MDREKGKGEMEEKVWRESVDGEDGRKGRVVEGKGGGREGWWGRMMEGEDGRRRGGGRGGWWKGRW